MKTALGIVTFGNAGFTRLALDELLKTVTHAVDVCLVVGKPGDVETANMARTHRTHPFVIVHATNKGFPASINDIYDWAWKRHDFDNLIMMGNDVIPYPGGVDSLIDEAAKPDHEWVCSSQYDVRSLCAQHPEARKFFTGDNFTFTDFSARPWDLHGPEHIRPPHVETNSIRDVHNLALFKRSVFEKIGYIDVNFYPAYFSDNDYCRRASFGIDPPIRGCTLQHSAYFHFWSRTIHQGGGHPSKAYANNEAFYCAKWGGVVGQERWRVPFGGQPYNLTPKPAGRAIEIVLLPEVNIPSRENEEAIVNYWKERS